MTFPVNQLFVIHDQQDTGFLLRHTAKDYMTERLSPLYPKIYSGFMRYYKTLEQSIFYLY